MILLLCSIAVFNLIAFKTTTKLTANQILHIWVFTTAFQDSFDSLVDFKYHGYWYFTQGVDWPGLLAHLALLPPINMMILNWYPFKRPIGKQFVYLLCWDIGEVMYESCTMLPGPWGYFHYGWWALWYSLIINPILMLILAGYYKWVTRLESKLIN